MPSNDDIELTMYVYYIDSIIVHRNILKFRINRNLKCFQNIYYETKMPETLLQCGERRDNGTISHAGSISVKTDQDSNGMIILNNDRLFTIHDVETMINKIIKDELDRGMIKVLCQTSVASHNNHRDQFYETDHLIDMTNVTRHMWCEKDDHILIQATFTIESSMYRMPVCEPLYQPMNDCILYVDKKLKQVK